MQKKDYMDVKSFENKQRPTDNWPERSRQLDELLKESPKDYSRIDHCHCWDNEGEPPCGLPKESHKRCCLCEERRKANIENHA